MDTNDWCATLNNLICIFNMLDMYVYSYMKKSSLYNMIIMCIIFSFFILGFFFVACICILHLSNVLTDHFSNSLSEIITNDIHHTVQPDSFSTVGAFSTVATVLDES